MGGAGNRCWDGKADKQVFFFFFFPAITICGWEAKDYVGVEKRPRFLNPEHNNVAAFNFRRRIRDPMAIMALLL